MGQSLSRRLPAPTTTPASAAIPGPGHSNDAQSSRRSLSSRILSSIPKPSLRSRPLSSSLTLPTHPEQTLRGKNRRWGLSRRHNVPANTEAGVSEYLDPLTEYDEHQVDRDVDEFGVITHRVPDNHTDSPATSAKGKERENDIPDVADDTEDDESLALSTSNASSLALSGDPIGDDEIVIGPMISPSPRQPPPLLPAQESERPPALLPSVITGPSPPQPSTQQTNANPRPFPPPGTLVVVQGVVHTTDVPRPPDRPVAPFNPTPPTTSDVLYSNANSSLDPGSTQSSLVPPESRPRNPLSGILPRPISMAHAVPSPSEPTIGSSNADSGRQTTYNAGAVAEDSEGEDHADTHPHGISMAQGPVGASGLSASSIDVLGTLLSVAAAATAASLLTGSSEPIFSSGLTSSQPSPSSNPLPQSPSFNSNIPSERPLSPTPTSDAGRMRHVWSSLRDRLGLGGGAHNSNHSNGVTSGLGPGQSAPSPLSDILRPRDPREIMLAEMARAFNLGLGLGGATPSTPSTVNPNTSELTVPDGEVLPGDQDGEQSSLPPPDSFERFLMDLQTDLRVTLMQGHEPSATGGAPRVADETVEDTGGDQPIPELQSLSDSDSEGFGTRHLESDDEEELDCEEDVHNEEDVHTAQEQPSGRTSPAVSAFGASTHYPSPHPTAAPLSMSPDTDSDVGANNRSMDNGRSGGVGAVYAPCSGSPGRGSHVPPVMGSGEELGGEEEGAVLGVVHSRETLTGRHRVEAQGCAVSGSIAMPPLDAQHPSNAPATVTGQDSSLLGSSSSSDPATPSIPNSVPGNSTLTPQVPLGSSTSASFPPSIPEATTQAPNSTNPNLGDSSMPFRLPSAANPASRTEHTPGGGINWWRMYRFPAIASPNPGQQVGPQGPSPLSQPTSRTPAQGPNHASTSRARTTDQDEMMASREVTQVSGAHSGLAQPVLMPPAATPTHMPETVSVPDRSTILPPSTNRQDSNSPADATTNLSEHRSNVVVPVIVVGLQSVNTDRQPPHMPHIHANHTPAIDDEDGEGMEFDSLEQPMSLPLHIPEPVEFRPHSTPSNTTQQEQNGQQPTRGRTWHSRAANAIRNLRPLRRNTDTVSPRPHEPPGSRTFLIYVIGGYYPPDHQIITGGNLDSFEALWMNRELAELLGQVKPPTVSKEEIEKSGLEIIRASMLEEYERQGRVATNCTDRCLICLDDYSREDELRVLTCKHAFHQGCVDRWLETGRNNCPACRTKGVDNENVGPVSATSPA